MQKYVIAQANYLEGKVEIHIILATNEIEALSKLASSYEYPVEFFSTSEAFEFFYDGDMPISDMYLLKGELTKI